MRSLLILFLFSCSDNTGYNSQPDITREDAPTTTISFRDFSTRLTNNLLISGRLCGPGDSADAEGRTYACEREEWLVTVDNINTCTPEGCTNVEVRPVIASLLIATNDQVTTFLEILPEIPVRSEVQSALESVLLRDDGNGRPIVVFR